MPGKFLYIFRFSGD